MKKKLFTSLLAMLLCGFAYSQESDVLLKKLVEKNVLTEAEADEIKEESKAEAELLKEEKSRELLKPIFRSSLVNFGGYGQLLYDYNNVRSSKNDLSIRCANISIDGRVNKNFKYLVFVEFTNPKLVEYWTEWAPNSKFNLRLGQYKASVSMEHVLSGSVVESIDYSRVIRNMFGYGQPGDVLLQQNEKGNMGRDMGLQASGQLFNRGDYCLLQYSAGIFQGAGMNSGDVDNNKDFTTSLYLQPTKGLRLGGAAYFGGATYSKYGEAKDTHVRNRWVASGEYATQNILLRSEYVYANDGGTNKEGVYTLALYQLNPTWSVLSKFDYYNNDTKEYTAVNDYTLGARCQFFGQCTAMVNYIYTNTSDRWRIVSAEADHHRVAAQLQVVF